MAKIDEIVPVRRRKGGQRGNLNASKNPWRAFWRRRAVKASDKWVVPFIEAYSAELLADKGGPDSATAGEKRAVEISQVARGAAMLILKEISERGFTQETENGLDLVPAAKELAKFLTLELNSLRTLGLNRREPKTVESLADIVAEIERENAEREAAEKASQDEQDGAGDEIDGGELLDKG